MKTKAQWFNEYSKSHRHPMNKKIHKVCVPLISFSLIGLIWQLPDPWFYPAGWPAFWGSLFLLAAFIFYLTWGDVKVIAKMVGCFLVPNIVLWEVMSASYSELILPLCVPVFILGWMGQFIGHKIEGAKPSFFEDLLFLLVGPAWIFEH